jgi:hypothetical protein
LSELADWYGERRHVKSTVRMRDVTAATGDVRAPKFSIAITSPPYINAQDYFRNFKLELYVLEGLMPFAVERIKEGFIGTERGDLMARVSARQAERHRELFRPLVDMERRHPRSAAVVHRYLADMGFTISSLVGQMRSGGRIVLVCGDNLLGGWRVPTWRLVNDLAIASGCVPVERFGDSIACRILPPKRKGHRGLIKREVVSVFRVERPMVG